jgi:hypothetical protein
VFLCRQSQIRHLTRTITDAVFDPIHEACDALGSRIAAVSSPVPRFHYIEILDEAETEFRKIG